MSPTKLWTATSVLVGALAAGMTLAQDGPAKLVRLDQYGDPLPGGAVTRIGTTRWWHGRSQQECPFRYGPQGKTLACCDGACVRILDATTGKELRRIVADEGINRFEFAPDGRSMVTGNFRGGALRLWDLASGQEIREITRVSRSASALAFTSDGKTFAAVTDDLQIRLWDVATWKEKGPIGGAGDPIVARSLHFIADGATLISGGGGSRIIQWWDIDARKELWRLDKVLDHSRLLTLSPDRKRLAAVVKPGVLHLWEAETGKEISRTIVNDQGKSGSWCLCFSADSQTLACGSVKTRFFASDNGRELPNWADDEATQWMAFSPDGTVLAQLGHSFIRLHDVKTGRQVARPGLQPVVLSVVFGSDGHKLVGSFRDGHTGRWDALSGKELDMLRSPPAEFAGVSRMLLGPALAEEGHKAALVDKNGVLHIWETTSGKELCRIDDPPVGEDQADLSLDGKLVVVKHQDRILRVWDTTNGKLKCALEPFGSTQFPHAHAFSPDGRVVATELMVFDNSFIRLSDTTSGKTVGKLASLDRSRLSCIKFSADGKFLVAAHGTALGPIWMADSSGACSVRFWDLATGRERARFPVKSGDIRSLALSPDGKTLAAADSDAIVLFELASGKERGRLAGHRGWVWSLAFSPTGRLLASGSLDHTALVWDITGVSPDGKLASHPAEPPEIQNEWSALRGTDAVRAYRALWALVAAERRTVPFLAEQLRPTLNADDKHLDRLAALMDDKRFEVRNRAWDELRQLGEMAVPALQQALKNKPSLEMRRRLKGLLLETERRPLSASQLQALRALEVLEHIGSAEARQVLQKLAKGAPQARQTREAIACLERINGSRK